MATLRNLRNLIMAGIDETHVEKICQYLQNEKAVASSRLFPYRFYTAFDILSEVREFKAKGFHMPTDKTKKATFYHLLIAKFLPLIVFVDKLRSRQAHWIFSVSIVTDLSL